MLFFVWNLLPTGSKQILYLNVQVDKGWYFAFNVEKWIIVAALGSPTHELQALVKIEGWQLLVVVALRL
jgi:hypothetical protein